MPAAGRAAILAKVVVSSFVVTHDPLSVDVVVASVDDGTTPAAGAVVSFLGQVRGENMGRRVVRLEYEGYEPLAVKAFQQISNEARDRWSDARLAIHHRLGTLEIGEASVAIAAASPHRAEAFAACRYAIERIKQIAPIWKHEYFEGGDVWVEGATADPEDREAREHAYRRACA